MFVARSLPEHEEVKWNTPTQEWENECGPKAARSQDTGDLEYDDRNPAS